MALHWLSSSSSPPLCLAAVICSVMCLFWFELQKAAVYLQFLASQLMLQQKYFAQNRTLVQGQWMAAGAERARSPPAARMDERFLDVSAGSYFHFTNSAFSFTVTSIIGNSQMLWVFFCFCPFLHFLLQLPASPSLCVRGLCLYSHCLFFLFRNTSKFSIIFTSF